MEKNSSQVWSGFRVANRAKIISKSAELKPNNQITLHGAHDGYKTLFGGCIHMRKLTFRQDSIAVSDTLKGNFKQENHVFISTQI